MTFASLLFAIGDWISWPIIFGICVLFAIWKKDQVRAAFKVRPFQFSLEAKNLKPKERSITKFRRGMR